MKIIIPQNYAQIRTNSLSGSIRMSVYYSSPLCWLCCPLTDGDHSNIHSSTAICMAPQPASQLLPTVIHSFIHLINRAFMENPNRLLNSLFTVLHDRDLDFRGPVRHFLFFSSSPLKHLNVQTKVTADQIRSNHKTHLHLRLTRNIVWHCPTNSHYYYLCVVNCHRVVVARSGCLNTHSPISMPGTNYNYNLLEIR